MSFTDQKNWDVLLVKISAITLLTVALTWLPKAFGALMQIFMYFTYLSSHQGGEFAEIMKRMQMQMLSTAIGELGSFIVLLFLARWMFTYPPIIRKALSRTQPLPEDTPLP